MQNECEGLIRILDRFERDNIARKQHHHKVWTLAKFDAYKKAHKRFVEAHDDFMARIVYFHKNQSRNIFVNPNGSFDPHNEALMQRTRLSED
jgi:hypothetical protein